MGFVCEFIPKEDIEKYKIKELNKRFFTAGTVPSRSWAISRGEDIWVRCFCVESDHTELDGGFTGVSYWDFFWKGDLMTVKLKSLDAGGRPGAHGWSRKKLLNIDIPKAIVEHKTTVLQDLERALTAYKDGGASSKCTSYDFTLEV